MPLILRTQDPFAVARELFRLDPLAPVSRETGALTAHFDVHEGEDSYLLVGDLPGVRDEDLTVHIEKGRLSIAGTRTLARSEDVGTYHLRERREGAFERTFVLPREADVAEIEAKLADGVLTVTVPKRADSKPRKISVAVS